MDLDAFKAIVTSRFPELAQSQFSLLTTGWDSMAVDVDDRLIFKFPRHETAEKSLRMEADLLTVIRPAVTMAVPDLSLIPGSPVFSRHSKLKGQHLLATEYELLSEDRQQELAADLALFYSELHALDRETMMKAGARPIRCWLPPEEILSKAWPVLSAELRLRAERTIDSWQQMIPDPHGITYGFFDGHGWNMAFDHRRHKLNGIYDFADSGFGSIHQEFIYSNFISPDLTARIIAEYERLTKRTLDRERIHLLTGVLRFSELAEQPHDSLIRHFVEQWATWPLS